ncbi:hypothetical protein BD324DRAFT_606465 [Kockovaella imperatae]|uniref:RanBP2-type domain-containing protein n=1 Tax=Kockovaella imperatae TaxID=4999 RepID=A0A1Y1USS9_9TREE|nr:hypothetical protein BD324DRAFT_606465 [Kockovaella imperatae]ORX40584.1 hypothetical protein BD324DRAFT_606465 [Kockovaella imperatae]
MDHTNSSGSRAARSERVNATPYRRPQQVKKSTSTPFSGLRNMISYALSPLFRQENRLALPSNTGDITMEPEVPSESGSEDNWGSSPSNTRQGDVLSMAEAAGRSGADFEDRAAEWRARGEVPGGRRDTTRRSLAVSWSKLSWEDHKADTHRSGPSHRYQTENSTPRGAIDRETQDAPGLVCQSRPKRRRGESSLPERAALPLFDLPATPATHTHTPHASASSHIPTALSAAASALVTFVEGKQDQAVTEDDTSVIDAMLANIRAAATPLTSASAAALTTFLAGKRQQSLSAEDVQLVQALTKGMRADTAHRLGGWSAGTPRSVKALPNSASVNRSFTPNRNGVTAPSTPGSMASFGDDTISLFTSPETRRHRVSYLGPGMSPRRMLGKSRSSLGLKPLLDLEADDHEESAKKRRRTEQGVHEDPNDSALSSPAHAPLAAHPSSSDSSSSSSTAATSHIKEKDTSRQPTGTLRHPLSQSFTAVSSAESKDAHDVVSIGKRRAADIMRALIVEEIGPVDQSTRQEEMIINPYDTPQSSSASDHSRTPSPNSAKFAFNSPRRSVLRATLKESPKRGAAAKLEATKSIGRQLTTLEVLTGKKSWQLDDDGHAGANGSPKPSVKNPDRKNIAGADQYSAKPPTPVSSTAPSSANTAPTQSSPKKRAVPEPASFKPFETPVLDSPSRPLPSLKPNPAKTDSLPASLERAGANPTEAPKFQLPAIRPIEPHDEPIEDLPRRKSPTKVRFDPNIIYFSAKDQALQVDKSALPFFTFTLPSAISGKDAKSALDAKALALKAPLATFHFTLSQMKLPAPLDQCSKPSAPASGGSSWTCDLCMLQNPATATEKCQICEAPKPTGKKADFGPLSGSKVDSKADNAKSDADWTCSLCMLKNPGSVKEKCTICEAPRP